jgi:hypothetical protein
MADGGEGGEGKGRGRVWDERCSETKFLLCHCMAMTKLIQFIPLLKIVINYKIGWFYKVLST